MGCGACKNQHDQALFPIIGPNGRQTSEFDRQARVAAITKFIPIEALFPEDAAFIKKKNKRYERQKTRLERRQTRKAGHARKVQSVDETAQDTGLTRVRYNKVNQHPTDNTPYVPSQQLANKLQLSPSPLEKLRTQDTTQDRTVSFNEVRSHNEPALSQSDDDPEHAQNVSQDVSASESDTISYSEGENADDVHAPLARGVTTFNIPSGLSVQSDLSFTSRSPNKALSNISPAGSGNFVMNALPRTARDKLNSLMMRNQDPKMLKRAIAKRVVRRSYLLSATKGEVETDELSNSQNPFYKSYEVYGQRLSKDAMLEVRKCRHRETGEKRIVKIIRNDQGQHMLPGDEFEQFKAIKKIDYPGIERVYDIWKYNRKYYIVTECHKWNYLVSSLDQIKKLDEPAVGQIIGQILMTLQYLKREKVIHGGINLHTVFLVDVETLQIKLTDLGTEMLLPKSITKQRAETVTFYAPEIFANVFDLKCDVWSTGVLMYMLLTGESPFFGITLKQIRQKIKSAEIPMDPETNPIWNQISEPAKDMLQAMLVKSVFKRCSCVDAIQHPWLYRIQMTPNYFESGEHPQLRSRLDMFRSYTLIKQKLQNLIVVAGQVYKDSQQFRPKLQLAAKTASESHDSDNYHISEEMIVDILSFTYEPQEIQDFCDEICALLTPNVEGDFDYREFIDHFVRLTIETAKNKLLDTFESYPEAKDLPITIREINDLSSAEREALNDIGWTGILLKVANEPNCEVSLDKLKDLLLDN